MKFIYQFFSTLILLYAASWGCSVNSSSNSSGLDQLDITWMLISNTPQHECIAEFEFINKGTSVVSQKDWALYFNQNTLFIGDVLSDSSIGRVEHVNGDLYRFLPQKEFSIAPNDTLRIRYKYKGYLIKERDAPCGAYFAISSKDDTDQIIMPKNFNIVSFTRENLAPDSTFLSTIPTAANEFLKNSSITSLSPNQVGKIIPSPCQFKQGIGKVNLSQNSMVCYAKGLENEAHYLVETLKKIYGISLKMTESTTSNSNSILLSISPTTVNGISAEAYRMLVSTDKGVQITGNDAAGVFYGVQSLLALLEADKNNSSIVVNAVEISDAPRFGYRGFLLDVARNFQTKENVFRLIDLLALYKVNKLNIRITEDEGWRIEIKGLPELTQVASKRGHTRDSKNHLTPSFGSGPNPNSTNNHGTGYYSRSDFKEIITYANQRHIQVIPEVCFPSHARAAIKAMERRYDYYMAKNEPQKAQEFRLIDPNDTSVYLSAQMYKDNIACVALPSVYHFYETVVKDFISMYEEAGLKMTTFNTGGDEVPKGAWAQSPLCIELMKTLPDIKNARQLQGYFLEKVLEILAKYNLEVSGWEEIVLNKDDAGNTNVNTKFLGKNILVLVWDNTGENVDLGYRIANAGYRVVLCNVTNLYFDLAYNTDPTEPGLYWGGFQDAIDPYVMTPLDVYKSANFDMFSRLNNKEPQYPGKARLNPDKSKNIVGLQAQLWSETLRGGATMEYYVVPKIFAFSEKAWAKAPVWETEKNIAKRNAEILKGWDEFSNRIGQHEFSRLDQFFGKYNYRIPPVGAIIENGMLKANIAFPGLTIRYTTDGSEPTDKSTQYTIPVKVSGNVNVRAFNQLGRGGKVFKVEQ